MVRPSSWTVNSARIAVVASEIRHWRVGWKVSGRAAAALRPSRREGGCRFFHRTESAVQPKPYWKTITFWRDNQFIED